MEKEEQDFEKKEKKANEREVYNYSVEKALDIPNAKGVYNDDKYFLIINTEILGITSDKEYLALSKRVPCFPENDEPWDKEFLCFDLSMFLNSSTLSKDLNLKFL